MAVDPAHKEALKAIADHVKANVERILKRQGLTHAHLQRTMGFSAPSGYWKMYSGGTLDLRKVVRMAAILGVLPESILSEQSSPSDRSARPYVEERLEQVEREVRSLRNQLKKR